MRNSQNVVPFPGRSSCPREAEADDLLTERVRLSFVTGLSDDEYTEKVMELRAKEHAWAKRWGVK